MKKNIFFYAALAAVTALAAVSCTKQENNPKPQGATGYYVLNNGSFKMNNSSVTVYNSDEKVTAAGVFASANGKGLGDTAQDILVSGDDVFISVNVSKIIFVTDRDLKIKKEIVAKLPDGTALSPRYLAQGPEGKVYVTYYEGYLGEISASDYSVRVTPVGASPEGCAYSSGRVFVSNSGGANYPNYEKTVSVVDAESLRESDRIEVNVNPATMVASGEIIYLFSLGDYGASPAKVQSISATSLEIKDLDCTSPTAIALSGNTLYVMCGGYAADYTPLPATIYKYNAADGKRIGKFVTDGTSLPKAYSLSATDDFVWVGCSDYKNNGDMYVFTKDGNLYDKFDTQGINPIKVAAR